MKITRTMTIETNEIQIGDRIEVGHYTATCQKLVGEGLALFLLDQYLDKPMQMNRKNTNAGGYDGSDLRKELNSGKILDEFAPPGAGALRERRPAPPALLRRDVRARRLVQLRRRGA